MAAETILNGVAKGRARVLIGWEAKGLDLLVRATGPGYQRLVAFCSAAWAPCACSETVTSR